MNGNSLVEPPLFRTADISSVVEHIYRRPDELLGFADLLMRWPSLSFYKVPFFTVMRRVGEDIGYYLHLYEARAIAFSDVLPDGVSDTTLEPEYEEDGSRKSRGPGARPRQKTAAELEAERMLVHLRFQPPFFFRLRFEDLYDNFDKLYFLRSEVEALEKANPECRITSPLRASEDSRYFGLYTTTEKNIGEVAHQALLRMANCTSTPPVQHPTSFRDGLLCPDSGGGWWTSRGGMRNASNEQDGVTAHIVELAGQEDDPDVFWEKAKALSRTRNVLPIPLLPALPNECVWPDLPTILPVKPKKRRTTNLKDIWPKMAVLKRLGIRDKEKLAKIIYSLHPFMTDEEVATIILARHGIKTSKETRRQQGRRLLNKDKPRKHTRRAS